MTAALGSGAGFALMLAGVAAVGYAVYLEMLRAAALSWWERATLLLPFGLISILAGLLLVR